MATLRSCVCRSGNQLAVAPAVRTSPLAYAPSRQVRFRRNVQHPSQRSPPPSRSTGNRRIPHCHTQTPRGADIGNTGPDGRPSVTRAARPNRSTLHRSIHSAPHGHDPRHKLLLEVIDELGPDQASTVARNIGYRQLPENSPMRLAFRPMRASRRSVHGRRSST